MRRGQRQRFMVGVGHGTCTCEGAAFEYLVNLEFAACGAPPRSRRTASGQRRGSDRVLARARDHPHLGVGRGHPAGKRHRSHQHLPFTERVRGACRRLSRLRSAARLRITGFWEDCLSCLVRGTCGVPEPGQVLCGPLVLADKAAGDGPALESAPGKGRRPTAPMPASAGTTSNDPLNCPARSRARNRLRHEVACCE